METVSVSVTVKKPVDLDSRALIIYLAKDEKLPEELAPLDAKLGGAIAAAINDGEFEGAPNEVLSLSTRGAVKPSKIILAGIGDAKNAEADALRQAAAAAAKSAKRQKLQSASVILRTVGDIDAPSAARAVVEGALLATYEFTRYKQQKDEDAKKRLDALTIALISKKGRAEIEESVNLARTYAEAANYMKDLANTPANTATPTYIADIAKKLGKSNGFEVKVLERKDMEKLGMGGMLAVSRGSVEPPKLVIMRYAPKQAAHTIGLVGKGITFDSGGISLKPSKAMDEMKFDKSGACAVLATFKAVSEARLAVGLVGILVLTENMPDGNAQKPGDVIVPYKGKSVEVLNTDAEGRLILADALSYIGEFKPDAVIDLATLTGACVIALGSTATGVMSTDKGLVADIVAASEKSGERVWELPLFPEYDRAIKGTVADIQNTGNGKAGTITAACFLKNFIGDYKWAHLDIAGTAYGRDGDEIPYYGKGSTGSPVRLLCNLLEFYAK